MILIVNNSQIEGIALAPTTFGGIVASAGRLTNSIRVSSTWFFAIKLDLRIDLSWVEEF